MDTTTRFEITNTCICTDENGEPIDYCFGCWDDEVECFAETFREFLDGNDSGVWRVKGFPLWSGDVDGLFEASNASEFLQAITIRGEWRLVCRMDGESMLATLYHHDKPTGGTMTVTYHEGGEQ
jgi:hypothetical protein